MQVCRIDICLAAKIRLRTRELQIPARVKYVNTLVSVAFNRSQVLKTHILLKIHMPPGV